MITAQSTPLDVVIPSAGGVSLRGWHWRRMNPRGVVVVVHGFGEHGGCYRGAAEAMGPALEVDVVSPDLRGHGRSPGRRGYVKDFDDLISDVRSALVWAGRTRPGLPRYILGHSNGGLLSLLVALAAGSDASGLILSNPALKLATPAPRYKVAVGHFLRRVAPGVTLTAKLDPEILTRDPEMQHEHRTDPLRHSRMSAPLYFGMIDWGAIVSARAPEITLPILKILGSADPVIDPEHSRLVFERLGSVDKTLLIFPKMLHEPLNELGREQVYADIISWLDPRLPAR